jgi:hypothetical protein
MREGRLSRDESSKLRSIGSTEHHLKLAVEPDIADVRDEPEYAPAGEWYHLVHNNVHYLRELPTLDQLPSVKHYL